MAEPSAPVEPPVMAESSGAQPLDPAQAPAIVADAAEEDNFDEAYDGGSDRSSLSSLATHIRTGVVENGRLYAGYGKGEYGLPRDEDEMDRIDMMHEKYFLLLGNRRWRAPIGADVEQVLDLGTGTGIWSIDFADSHTSAEVTGVDIAPTQPSMVPPNCHFEVDDVEEGWTFRKDHFDFIFSRDLIFAIRDFPKLIKQGYEHLKPGGWLELECIYGVLGNDDDTEPESSAFREYDQLVRQAATAFGTPLEDPDKFGKWFEAAGFESITNEVFKMPSNPWPKDETLKMVGMFERENLVQGLQGMSVRLFEKGLGWKADRTQDLVNRVLKEIRNPAYHYYYPFYVTYGRKPLDAAT